MGSGLQAVQVATPMKDIRVAFIGHFLVLTLLVCRPGCLGRYPPRLAACARYAESLGVNMTSFPDDAVHGIHSITVQDIRYFFDPSFPAENSIPTINTNLTEGAPRLLTYAPSISADFFFPSGQLIDFILSNNDAGDDFYIRGIDALQKMLHGAHMHDAWHRASRAYRIILQQPPKVELLCPCLVNEEENGIIDVLKASTIGIRHKYDNNTMPRTITDKASWDIWREVTLMTVPDQSVFNLAVYIYCKIHSSNMMMAM